MIDRDIRAYLRGATAFGILNGWQGPHTDARSYCIAPQSGGASEQSLADTVAYCEQLERAGIKPLYRNSEP